MNRLDSSQTSDTPASVQADGFLYTFKELMSKKFPPNKWLVDGLIPASGITVLSALPGSYKTWLLLHIVMSVARGTSVFDEFSTEQANVLMIDEENGARLIQERLMAMQASSDMPIRFMFDSDFKLTSSNVDSLIERCKRHNVRLVTIDSLIRIHSANENDAGEMSKVFRYLKRISASGITILITHHNRKPGASSSGGSQEMRGSSDILAALDCHLALSRKDRQLKLMQTKVRFCEEMQPVSLEVSEFEGVVKFMYRGSARVVSQKDVSKIHILQILSTGPKNQTSILDGMHNVDIKMSINTLRSILGELVSEGKLVKQSGGRNSVIYRCVE